MASSFPLPSTEPTRYIDYRTSCTGIESKLLHCGSRKLLHRQCPYKVSVQCSNSSGMKVVRKYISLSYN